MGYKTNTIRNAAGEGENKYLYYYEYRNYKIAKIAEPRKSNSTARGVTAFTRSGEGTRY